MKKKRTTMILFGLCALIWSAKAVYEIVAMQNATAPVMLYLDAACALCWILTFAAAAKRYRSGKDK